MIISPIQYPVYQQPNFYQQYAQPCVYPPQIVVPQPQFIPQPIVTPAPPIYPEYDIYSHDPNKLDKVYSPVVCLDSAEADIRKNLLYSQNKIQELLEFGANKQMKDMYPKIKDNKDFKDLLNSEHYQNGVGFINLLDTIAYVKFLREEKLRPINLPANIGYNLDTTDYKKYDTADYLRILNNFVKSDKISDDLKRYYIAKESKNLSAYYNRMDKISESNDVVSTIL